MLEGTLSAADRRGSSVNSSRPLLCISTFTSLLFHPAPVLHIFTPFFFSSFFLARLSSALLFATRPLCSKKPNGPVTRSERKSSSGANAARQVTGVRSHVSGFGSVSEWPSSSATRRFSPTLFCLALHLHLVRQAALRALVVHNAPVSHGG